MTEEACAAGKRCGTVTGYRNGGRCPECKAVQSQRNAAWKARSKTKQTGTNVFAVPAPAPVAAQPKPGRNVIAVHEELELLRLDALDRPAIVAQAISLAEILDDNCLVQMHVMASKQLEALLTKLRPQIRKRKGRNGVASVQSVQSMTESTRRATR